jgi:hypothetical protein
VTGVRARELPSSIFTAAADPSGSANASTPSAPALSSSPGTSVISRFSSLVVPEVQEGNLRIASATVRSGVPGSASTRARNARATPPRVSANTGAPQPSTPTA